MLRIARKSNKYENAAFEIIDTASMPFKENVFDVSCISLTLHDMLFAIRENVLIEMARITKSWGMIIVVDYAPLPENSILRFVIYNIIKLYETEYYPEFARSS
jgi:ubiquinone/menaquinone biosynthesis C-methylase UbiE